MAARSMRIDDASPGVGWWRCRHWRTGLLAAACTMVVAACSGHALPTARADWGEDFRRFSPPTADCAGGTLAQLRTRMRVAGPLPRSAVVASMPELARTRLQPDDALYAFEYTTDPDSETYWGFRGHLIARGDCIVHVGALGYDN